MAKKIRLPSIVSKLPNDLRNFLRVIRESFDGATIVEVSDLVNGGIADIGGDGGLVPTDGILDLTQPPAPTGLTASGSMTVILLQWNQPPVGYISLAYTEVWRSATDDLGAAVKIGSSNAFMYADPVGVGSSYYYWVRFVSYANVAGSYNGISGVLGATSEDPAALLDLLTDQITKSQLATDLLTPINSIDEPTTGLTAQIAAITSTLDAVQTSVNDLVGTPTYDSGTTYHAGDKVQYGGGLYEALGDTTGNLPTNATYWTHLGDYSSLFDTVSAQAVTLSDHEARISDTEDGLVSEASDRTTLATQIRGSYSGTDVANVSTGLLYSERTARSSADSSQVSRLNALEATVNNGTTGVAATATALDSVEVLVNSGTTGNNALASSMSALTTTVGGYTTTIASHTSSIDGLGAQWTVKIDNNGFPAGIGLASETVGATPFSEFYGVADRFAFINLSGTVLVVNSITRSGTTATATTATAHGLAVDGFATITGAEQKPYNGTKKVLSVISTTKFTFTVSGSPATPATVQTGFPGLRAAPCVVPFIVQGGVVVMDNAVIKNLTATNFVGGTINANTVTAGVSISTPVLTAPTINGGVIDLSYTNGKFTCGKPYYSSTLPGWSMDYNAGSPRIDIGDATQYFRYTLTGGIVVAGQITILGGSVSGGYLDVNGQAGINGGVTAGTDVRFWAGSTFADRANAPFTVDENGQVKIKSAATGARLDISGGLIRIFDANNVLRVKMGVF